MKSESLGSLLKTRKGRKPDRLFDAHRPGLVPYLDISAVEHGTKRQFADPTEVKVVSAGAVVMVWDGARSGWVGMTPFKGVLGSTLVELESPLERRFLAAFLRTQFEHINSNARGTGIPHVNPDVLKAIEVPLLSKHEQLEIASLIERANERAKSAENRLASAHSSVDVFHQSLASVACSGRLTEDWRQRSQPKPAMAALARRRAAESRRLGSKYNQQPIPDASELPEIPETWAWAALPELGELGRGKSKHRPRNDPSLYGGKVPFIQTGDVARSRGRIASYAQTYNEKGLSQSRIWPSRTVCITIAANIADSGLLTFPACFPDSVVGLIADESVALPEYVELFVRTARENLSAFAPATAQANINLAILSELAVAIPPLDEQREIIGRVDALAARADDVRQRLDRAQSSVRRTTRAVAARALRGDLSLNGSNPADAVDGKRQRNT
jgi:type I restriction enzyme, S subunit